VAYVPHKTSDSPAFEPRWVPDGVRESARAEAGFCGSVRSCQREYQARESGGQHAGCGSQGHRRHGVPQRLFFDPLGR